MTICASASGVDDPFRDPLVIEVGHFLPGMEVFQQGRTTFAGSESIIGMVTRTPCWVVRYPLALSTRALSSCCCFGFGVLFTAIPLMVGPPSWIPEADEG